MTCKKQLRERKRERERETDRKTDRQTERERERGRKREILYLHCIKRNITLGGYLIQTHSILKEILPSNFIRHFLIILLLVYSPYFS